MCMHKIILSVSLFSMILISCVGTEKRKPIYVDIDETTEVDSVERPNDKYLVHSGEEITVPFRQENGIKYVQVKVNGLGFEMIFDTGCSNTLISIAEANYLYQKGKLSSEDIIGESQSQIADGSFVENMVVNLREVIINDQIICPNVQATVSGNVNSPLLLGNEVLDRTATITIDNENENLIFRLK